MYKYLRRYYPSLVVPDIQRPAQSWHPFLLMLVAAASMTLMLNGPFYTALQAHILGQAGLQLTLIFLVFLVNPDVTAVDCARPYAEAGCVVTIFSWQLEPVF